jgi:asparagine synthase (glutamine-hydrolysing)
MCGICGAYHFKGEPVDPGLIDRMNFSLRHRGPDGEGSYLSGEIGLGSRRLSIIDLEGGSQPISNEDRTLFMVFNGEIYNFIELRKELEARGHVFRTRTDTEVIIHGYEEWGLDCVTRFNGIFAFALWDQPHKRLVLARDHLGVKPLYYTLLGNRLLFASEIKALLVDQECPREVDLPSLGQLFTLRYVLSPDTLFKGIKKLPPAHLMVVGSKGMEIRRYWRWTPQVREHLDKNHLIEAYQSLLEDAVRLQLRSDVPVGLFLSSGVDSGTLLAIMSKYAGRPVHTFTIGFEDGEGTNETADARALAEHFGADHAEMIVTSQDYQNYYERYLWDLEEPVGNEPAAAFYFVSQIASREVKVALCGQGVDELWAGYHRHIGVKLSQVYSRLPRLLTEKLVRPVVERVAKNERWKRGVLSLNEPDLLNRFVKIYSFYSADMKAKLFQPWLREELSPDGYEARQALQRLQADVEELDPLTQMLYIDTRANLPDDLLLVADKTAMANSLEARVPYLDYRLVEFVESLPPQLKLHGFRGKYLHKKAAEKWLPKKVVHQKKKGFAHPIDKWLRGQMRQYVRECLLSDQAAVKRYFNRDYIEEILRQHEANRQDYLRHIYLLISFELWHQKFLSA